VLVARIRGAISTTTHVISGGSNIGIGVGHQNWRAGKSMQRSSPLTLASSYACSFVSTDSTQVLVRSQALYGRFKQFHVGLKSAVD
jgi:hypothetical protein